MRKKLWRKIVRSNYGIDNKGQFTNDHSSKNHCCLWPDLAVKVKGNRKLASDGEILERNLDW